MKISNNTTFANIIFVNCKDDFDRIRVIMNIYGCNQLDANRILAKMREDGKV